MQHITAAPRLWSLTCNSVVDAVVSLPQPDNGLGLRLYLTQTLGRHVLKVIGTMPAAKEAPDVASHGLQHLQRVCSEAARDRLSHLIFLRE